MTAAEIGEASGIPEHVIVEKFGLRGKHIAEPDEHVSDLAVAAGERLFAESGVDPAEVDAVMYYGSTWKDWAVWQVAPHIAYRLGCTNAFAVEYDSVSHGTPIALRIARDMLRAEPELRNILMVAASRESYLLDYPNARARFMINFGDGAVAQGAFHEAVNLAGGNRERPPLLHALVQVQLVRPATDDDHGAEVGTRDRLLDILRLSLSRQTRVDRRVEIRFDRDQNALRPFRSRTRVIEIAL
jgi:hypothetical protein